MHCGAQRLQVGFSNPHHLRSIKRSGTETNAKQTGRNTETDAKRLQTSDFRLHFADPIPLHEKILDGHPQSQFQGYEASY